MGPEQQAEQAIEVVRSFGAVVQPGLSEAELAEVETDFAFRFAPEHRAFLSAGLPVGPRWPDWRQRVGLEIQLNAPVTGVLFDVRENSFWPDFWGPCPRDPAEREVTALARLADVPRLIPLYSHRYLPAEPAPRPSPVLSVNQTDVVVYGATLIDYLRTEFGSAERRLAGARRVPFWSDLAAAAQPHIGPTEPA